MQEKNTYDGTIVMPDIIRAVIKRGQRATLNLPAPVLSIWAKQQAQFMQED